MALLAKASQGDMANTEVRIKPQRPPGWQCLQSQMAVPCPSTSCSAGQSCASQEALGCTPCVILWWEASAWGPERRNSQGGENNQTYWEAAHVGPDVVTDALSYPGVSKRLLKVLPFLTTSLLSLLFVFGWTLPWFSVMSPKVSSVANDDSKYWRFWASKVILEKLGNFKTLYIHFKKQFIETHTIVHRIQETQYQIISQKCGV